MDFQKAVTLAWDNADLAASCAEAVNGRYFSIKEANACHVFIEKRFLPDLSGIIAGLVFTQRERYVIEILVNKIFIALSDTERQFLVNRSAELMRNETFKWGLFSGNGRGERLSSVIEKQILHTDIFDIHGFELFRMTGYRAYITAVLSVAADELLESKEDDEYTDLLKSYLSSHSSDFSTIHLLLKKDGFFCVLGESGYGQIPLEGGKIEGFEDLIVTSLLAFAPQSVIIHNECCENNKASQTDNLIGNLRNIFGSSIQLK